MAPTVDARSWWTLKLFSGRQFDAISPTQVLRVAASTTARQYGERYRRAVSRQHTSCNQADQLQCGCTFLPKYITMPYWKNYCLCHAYLWTDGHIQTESWMLLLCLYRCKRWVQNCRRADLIGKSAEYLYKSNKNKKLAAAPYRRKDLMLRYSSDTAWHSLWIGTLGDWHGMQFLLCLQCRLHLNNGCQRQLKTGAVLLDLTAAYDTVWHTGLLYN